jgi:hypothetical protein
MFLNIRPIYLVGFLFILTTERMFYELTKVNTDKMVLPLCMFLSFFFIGTYSPFVKRWFYLVAMYLAFMILESLYVYNTPFKYPHVFQKIMVLFLTFFTYGFYKRFNPKVSLAEVIIVTMIMFFANAIIVNKSAFSAASFTSHDRGFGCSTVYTLLLPFLYYFNRYFLTRQFYNLLYFLGAFALIMFLQHRTVWVAMGVAMALNIFFLRKTNYKVTFDAIVPIAIFIFLVGVFASAFILSDEKITEKLNKNFEQIMNPFEENEDGRVSTSQWRQMQWQSYWPFVEKNFIFGMRFAGFELPAQFVEHTGKLAFDDASGHHFHSVYMDRLFYQGLIGLLLMMLPPLMYLYVKVYNLRHLTIEQIVLVCFIASGITYGISYVYPDYYFAVLGLALLKIDQEMAIETHKTSKSLDNISTQSSQKEKEIYA